PRQAPGPENERGRAEHPPGDDAAPLTHGGVVLHLLAFVEHPDHVCCRYRLRAFEPPLRRAGHSIEYHPHPRHWWHPLARALPPADACIIQRRLPSSWELRWLRRRYPRLIFDFDDAVWLR